MKVQCIMFFLSAFLLSLNQVAGFECYVCKSDNNAQCTELDPPTSLPKKTCTDHEKYDDNMGFVPNCYKYVSKYYGNGKEEVTVIRGCAVGNWGQKASCEEDHRYGGSRECFCPDALCNGATPSNSHVPHTLLALCVLGSALVAYLRN